MKNITQTLTRCVLTLVILIIGQELIAQTQVTLPANQTSYTVPAGVYNIQAEVWGGGGHGANRTSNGVGAGGGGGGYSRKILSVTPGQSISYSVGTGSSSNSDGGSSWFVSTTTVRAYGGKSAQSNTNTAGAGAALGVGDLCTRGGNGAAGSTTAGRSGGGGEAGDASGNGGNANVNNGGTGRPNGGDGANGVTSGNNGNVGNAPGGGGSGAYRNGTNRNGGNGGNGQIILTLYYYEINVRGNGNNIASGDNSPSANDHTDFGTVNSTNGFVDRVYTIQNLGSQPLTISGVTLSGSGSSEYSIINAPASSVAGGGSTTFTVRFDPSTTGTKNATVNIANNDPDEGPYTFAITGVGVNPEINVQGNAVNILHTSASPSLSNNTDFGSVSIEGGSTTVVYTIQNLGVGALTVGTVSLIGTDAAHYTIVSTPPASIAQGANATFSVRFNPTTVGYKTVTVSIMNNDANENPYIFTIRGLGVRTYPDTDGDGVSDNVDIDDDNDGITDVEEQAACIASGVGNSVESIFLNETFGAGPTRGLININIPGASCTYCYEDGIVGPDYGACNYQYLSTLNDGEYVVINSIADHGWSAPEDHTPGDDYGRMAVFNASYEPGIFYETEITGILPNRPITYSFWALNIMPKVNYNGSIKPNITVQFLDMSNNIISTFNTGEIGRCGTSGTADNNCDVSEWRQFTTSVNLGAVTTFKIRFLNNAPGGSGNDLALDDIVIRQQYCDRDGDGIADIFDLDSDNDGIPDVEEAGFKALTVGRGMINLESGWVDANHNGLHDSIDALIASNNYVIPDTDGDGIRDYLDLDSDNDSLFDVDEAGIFNGDGDINGDGAGDGVDTDRDGILDLYDMYAGRGTHVRPFAQNTDGLGNPDYMSLDSDGNGIFDIAEGIYGAYDANNDGRIDGITDADKDGILDSFDTNPAVWGSPRNIDQKLYIEFDGRNDYAESPGTISGLSQMTMMGWIKVPADASEIGYVFGQGSIRFQVANSGGLKLVYFGNSVNGVVANLIPDTWYHIAMVHDGNATGSNPRTLIYVNGKLEVANTSTAASGPLPVNTTKFMMGRHPDGGAYFKGSIEEVRVFNRPLTADQIQKMVYQEIKQQGANGLRGEIVPKNVEGTVWASLLAYYRMDVYKDDVIDNYVTPTIDEGAATNLTRIYNVKKLVRQTAPMPFVTTQDGPLDAAVSQNNFVNPADIYTYDWSIVQVKHNVDVPVNDTSLGMIVEPGKTLVASGDNLIGNNWYLKLDGTIDLEGRAQLVQGASSDLDVTSAGRIERDQQGTTNKFNYNYWASPVGPINTSTNNNAFTVAGVMKDGTNPANPQNIQWTSSINSTPTTPITLSSYWIFKFQNVANNYANWASVGQNGALQAGMGFTLKGSSAPTASQNFVFVGKPNNGNIMIPLSANNLNLCGNPYPSALDANQFIQDNTSRITGALYFWEHYDTNTSHNLLQYQGGYATYTMVGGTPPVSPTGISGLGTSTRIPGRYIPVGQGFFVEANNTSGNLTFRNLQRTFRRETDAGSNIMFRGATDEELTQTPANTGDVETADNYKRVRLGFNSYNNFHRQILIGFMEDKATAGIDVGYDAPHFDDQPNDMYFVKLGGKYNILGEGYFSASDIFPLGTKCYMAGTVEFTLDALENFDDDQPVYIYDAQTAQYHNIRNQPFSVAMTAGENLTRFSLRFQEESALGNDEISTLDAGIYVAHTQSNSTLNIRNNTSDATVQTVTLFNMLGQQVSTWNVADMDQTRIELPVVNLATGTYIAKIKTDKGDVSKKIAIK